MQITGIFNVASQQAKWLAIRQQTIAENIAHANIPGYASKDVKPFNGNLDVRDTNIKITNSMHLAPIQSNNGFPIVSKDKFEKLNIENELMKTTEIRTGFELNTAIVSAFNRMILNVTKS